MNTDPERETVKAYCAAYGCMALLGLLVGVGLGWLVLRWLG